MKIVFEHPVVNVVELATGPKGDTGPASTIPGPPNTLTAGTVTQIPAGGQPTVSITGTAPNQTLNLGLVDGANGIGVPTTGNNPGDLLRWNGTVWIQTTTKFHEGTGNPNGVVSAPVGSQFVNTESGGYNGARRWTKATGTGNTGWVVVDGDTGLMDARHLLVNSWQASAFEVQRTAMDIRVRVDWVRSGTHVDMLTLPSGYRPTGASSIYARTGTTWNTFLFQITGLVSKSAVDATPTGGAAPWAIIPTNPSIWPSTPL